ncbi:hypothetical protein Patl1_22909 [Pistacia atlantica]|uniref:Uncharacterized protein n=1 Tax=Pistacia atlantica TaxID=434234 RepID=A0ACC1A0V2_9ROSI|nr:hypothetical protein Patl1_22909 [Pistacia atlantica]
MVNVTQAKAKLTKLRSTQNSTFDDDKHFSALDRQDKFYIAQMLIGNPIQFVYVLVDTGASLFWTQCQPCRECFHQSYPIYNRRASFTYQKIPCNHPRCNYGEPGSIFRCVNGNCVYRLGYGDSASNSRTEGFASFESFRFLVNDNGNAETFTLLFGCSIRNLHFGFANDEDNRISGILGLDLSQNSLASQLSDVFSYCIVPYDDNYPFDVHPHKLRFGADVFIPPHSIPTTNYVRVEGKTYYYLRLLDISVGGSRLNFPPGTFEPSPASGFLIDSGAPFTTLTRSSPNGLNVFEMVNTAFSRYYDSLNLARYHAHPDDVFRVCYRNRRNFRDYPSMTFHFQGADYQVDGRFVKFRYPGDRHFCVPIMDDESISILGAYHMQNMRIIHNGQIRALQFFPANCAGDHF